MNFSAKTKFHQTNEKKIIFWIFAQKIEKIIQFRKICERSELGLQSMSQ